MNTGLGRAGGSLPRLFFLVATSALCLPAAARADAVGRAKAVTASWYGSEFSGRKTANGERYDPRAFTAAHKTLPLGTTVRVTNPRTGASVLVTITDRGPYRGKREIDLSRAAAREVGILSSGVARLLIEVL